MRTMLDIPNDVLEEAMHFSGEQTHQQVVVTALKEFSRRNKLDKMLSFIGRSDTFMKPEELQSLRSQEIFSNEQ